MDLRIRTFDSPMACSICDKQSTKFVEAYGMLVCKDCLDNVITEMMVRYVGWRLANHFINLMGITHPDDRRRDNGSDL